MRVERRRNESQQPSFDDLFADSDIFDDDDEPISDDDMSAMSDMLDFDDDSFDIDSAFQDQQEQAGDQPSRRRRGKRGGRGGRNRKKHQDEPQQTQTAGGDEELDISDLFGDDIDGMFGDGGSGMGSIDDLFGDDDDAYGDEYDDDDDADDSQYGYDDEPASDDAIPLAPSSTGEMHGAVVVSDEESGTMMASCNVDASDAYGDGHVSGSYDSGSYGSVGEDGSYDEADNEDDAYGTGYGMGGSANRQHSGSSAVRGHSTAAKSRQSMTAQRDGSGVTRSIDIPTATDDGDATRTVSVPAWVGRNGLQAHYAANVSHAFLLDGNIGDYMVSNIHIKDGIILTLDPNQDYFEVIASYDQAHGLRFDALTIYDQPNVTPEEYKRRFIQMMQESQRRLRIPVTEDVPSDAVELFEVLADIFDTMPDADHSGKILLFIDYLELLVPQSVNGTAAMRPQEKTLAILLSGMCRSEMADRAGNCLVMTTNNIGRVSDTVYQSDNRVDRITVPNPHYDERVDFIDNVLDIPENTLSDGRQIFRCEDGVSKEYLAVNTAGLACFQIEDIVLRALAADRPITTDLVKERKNEIIKNDYNDVIEIMEPKTGFEAIGGLGQVKRFFKEEVIEPIHQHQLETVPMGVLLMGPPGSSKSVSTDFPIYKYDPITNRRYLSTMGEVAIGDYVYGSDGYPTLVTGVFPQGKKRIYELHIKDGRTVECTEDHLWRACNKTHGRYKYYVRSTKEMLDRGLFDTYGGRKNRCHFYLPMNAAIVDAEMQYRVDPYVVGVFLGDGCLTKNDLILSSSDDDLVFDVAKRLNAVAYRRTQSGYSWCFYWYKDGREVTEDPICMTGMDPNHEYRRIMVNDIFTGECADMATYAHEKHIPKSYMMGSIEQKWELIRGLMDTDGGIRNKNSNDKNDSRYNMSYTSTSLQLINDFRNLLFSMGISTTYSADTSVRKDPYVKKTDMVTQGHHTSYNVYINVPAEIKPNFFNLKRKKDIAIDAAQHPKKRDYTHIGIDGIRDTGQEKEAVCIKVAAEDECFLVGEDCVVTHNTMMSKAVAYESHMNCINLNLNRLLSKYVGESERNLDRALQCAIDMQPTIIFIDEIDEALPKRHMGDNSGVTQRINKRLLEFFSDTTHRGQVIILAATNYPEKIDPAFKRAGRFDNRIPMFAPGVYDRVRIIKILAQKTGYSISCLKDPDEMMRNPFVRLKDWLDAGNVPYIEDDVFEMDTYFYTVKRGIREFEASNMIPRQLIDIVDKPTITYEQFYRCCDILFSESIEDRKIDDTTGTAESDEDYYGRIERVINNQIEILGDNQRNRNHVRDLLIYRDKFYKPYETQTDGKTGAELEVTVQKAVSLFKKWKIRNTDRLQELIAQKIIKNENDIPWMHVIEACKRTASAISGIKSMEDYALIDTSDTDFIPDEVYGETNTSRKISYIDRRETLLRRMNTNREDFDKNLIG